MRATPIACTLALLLAACGAQDPAAPAAADASAPAPAEAAAMPEPTPDPMPPADAPPSTDAVPAAAAAPPADETPVVPDAMAGTCDASSLDWAIGQPGDDALLARAMAESGATNARFLRPGMAMTMDYRPDRLVIDLDEDGRVTATRCG